MAIAPSKLGQLIARHWEDDDVLVQRLRESGLVWEDASDSDLRATFSRAREEHSVHPAPEYNSPHERVRVFLAPFLTDKGTAWAVPVDSLDLEGDV